MLADAVGCFGPAIQPRRLATRHTCVSTGKTARRSEYISTHLAVFAPTAGSASRNASAAASSMVPRQSSDVRPVSAWSRASIWLMRAALRRAKPPQRMRSSTSSGLARRSASQLRYRFQSAANVRRYSRSRVCVERMMKMSSASGSRLLKCWGCP